MSFKMFKNSKYYSEKEVIDLAARIREGKGLEGIDFDKVELIRGETPEDIEIKCLNICKQYLSSIWTKQTTDTIQVRRITGGLVNQLYYCGIRQVNSDEKVPQEVVIKLYGESEAVVSDYQDKIDQLVISLIFSNKNIGPQIYGIFEEGIILKYYQQRPFSSREGPKLIDKVFRTLARIHSFEFPIRKNGKRMIDMLEKTINDCKLKEVEDIDIFQRNDLKIEINWFKGIIKRLNSPVVFCHNDYRSDNLLIIEQNDELVVCDYDLSGYNYRGYDFAFLIREWNNKHFMESTVSIEDIPLEDQMKTFIEIYVDECQLIHGKRFGDNESNSVDHILKEAKIFVMFTYLYFMYFTVLHMKEPPRNVENNNEGTIGEVKNHMMLEIGYTNYHKIKEILNKQNLFDQL